MYISEITVPRPQGVSADYGLGPWHLSGLTDITILFGKNGAGKSLLLREWQQIDSNIYHYISPERGGYMTYDAQHLNEVQSAVERMRGSNFNFMNNYKQKIITRLGAYFTTFGAYASRKKRERHREFFPEDFSYYLSRLFPDFHVEIIGEPPYSIFTRVRTGEKLGDDSRLHMDAKMSSGEAQLLTIALDILSIVAIWVLKDQQNKVILIDEPDAHIHPDLQERFADFLSSLVTFYRVQIVIATHSTTLLSSFGLKSELVTSSIFLKQGEKEFKARPFDDFRKMLISCLGGHLLTGPLFGAPLLLVEGDDDVRIWSQVSRHNTVNFSVIHGGGTEIKNYHKELEKLFSALMTAREKPIGFAIIDNDMALPQPTPNNPQDYIKFFQLQCREAENLYLSDEVLDSMGIAWAPATELIEGAARDFPPEIGHILANVRKWDRKTENFKPTISAISRILDKQNLDWTVRVGKVIGRSEPVGQLAEFLGEELVKALWSKE